MQKSPFKVRAESFQFIETKETNNNQGISFTKIKTNQKKGKREAKTTEKNTEQDEATFRQRLVGRR